MLGYSTSEIVGVIIIITIKQQLLVTNCKIKYLSDKRTIMDLIRLMV